MIKKIRSYDDLLKERERLEILLETQKQVVRYDIEQIKEELKPARTAFNFIRKITTKDKTNLLLSLGTDFAINSVVKQFILSKAGWITKLVVPFFLKNYSSHFISEQKDKWLEKLRHWIAGLRNGQEEKTHAEED